MVSGSAKDAVTLLIEASCNACGQEPLGVSPNERLPDKVAGYMIAVQSLARLS